MTGRPLSLSELPQSAAFFLGFYDRTNLMRTTGRTVVKGRRVDWPGEGADTSLASPWRAPGLLQLPGCDVFLISCHSSPQRWIRLGLRSRWTPHLRHAAGGPGARLGIGGGEQAVGAQGGPGGQQGGQAAQLPHHHRDHGRRPPARRRAHNGVGTGRRGGGDRPVRFPASTNT